MYILGYSTKFNHIVVLIKIILKKMLSFSKNNEINNVIEKANVPFFV